MRQARIGAEQNGPEATEWPRLTQTESFPSSHAAYVFYVKLELAQNRIVVDEGCLSLHPMCRLARMKGITPAACARLVIGCAMLDGDNQLSDARVSEAVSAALHRLRTAE